MDENAETISYEEYHPFGTSSYRLHKNDAEASLKRYRYVGKERDEETGLYYYGARYYAAWIGRWTAADPMAARRIWLTPYNYCQNNPINVSDPTGALDDGGEKAAQRKKRISTRSSNTPTYTAPSFDNTDNTRVAEGKIPTIEDLNTKPAVVKKQENKQKEAYIGPCDRHLYDPDFLAANKRKWEWEKMKADFISEGMAKNPISFGGNGFGAGANKYLIEGFEQGSMMIATELAISKAGKAYRWLKSFKSTSKSTTSRIKSVDAVAGGEFLDDFARMEGRMHSLDDASKGSLLVEGSAFQKEIDFALELKAKGHNVILRGKNAEGGDLFVDGIQWELKTLDAGTVNAVQQNIKKGIKQGIGRVFIDGRNAGLTDEIADDAINGLQRLGRLGGAKEIKVFTTTGEKLYQF